jgi:hypothetical protein
MDDKPFTVKLLRETLETMPPDLEVWVRLEGVADVVTHVKLGSLGHGEIKLILQCEP